MQLHNECSFTQETNMSEGQKHVSPWGEMGFTSLARPTKEGKYTVTLKFNTRTQEGADFKALVGNVNSAKVITNKTNSKIGQELADDEYIVKFNSQFQPRVIDENGDELEGINVPFFDSRSDSGQARVMVIESHKGMNPTVYLKEVALKDLQLAPREGGLYNSELQQLIIEDAQQA